MPGFDWGSEFGPSSPVSLKDKWLESHRTYIAMSVGEAHDLVRTLLQNENSHYRFSVSLKSIPCIVAVDAESIIAYQWEKWHARGRNGGLATGIKLLYGGDQYSSTARIGDFRCAGRWGRGPSQYGISTELRETCEHDRGTIVVKFAIAANPSY